MTPAATTAYSVTVTLGDCEGSGELTITVSDNPTPTITADPARAFVKHDRDAGRGSGYDSYSWSTGATTQTIDVTPTATTAYDVTVTLGDCEGSGELTITVSDNPTPTVTADPGERVCAGVAVTLDAGAGYDSYVWSTGASTQTITVTPTATTTYDVTVALGDCEGSGEITIDVQEALPWYRDADGDGYGDPTNAVEDCEQPDGYVAGNTDCDDTDHEVNPGAEDECDVDRDCDGQAPQSQVWHRDADEDGYGDPADVRIECSQPAGYVDNDGDCDDSDPGVNPAAAESCNGIDDNCDGQIDEGDVCLGACCIIDGTCELLKAAECAAAGGDFHGVGTDCSPNPCGPVLTWYRDADRDGYGDPAVSTQAAEQPSGYVANDDDCDDNDPDVNPDAPDCANQPDGIDNDCNGLIDDDQSCQDQPCPDADDDGICDDDDLCP